MFALLLAVLLLGVPIASHSQDTERPQTTNTMASIAKEANLRTGPGWRFPIIFTYKHFPIPVEILQKHQNWRKVRDFEGDVGWLNNFLLKDKQSIIITAPETALLNKEQGQKIGVLHKDVTAYINKCGETHCAIQRRSWQGWVKKSDIWGYQK